MDTTFDIDLEMGHSSTSRKGLRAASITGALAVADTTSGHADDGLSPDGYGVVDDDYYGGPQAGTYPPEHAHW